MINTITHANIQEPSFFVWAKTSKAIELIWAGDNIVIAIYQLVSAKLKYKAMVRLDWV